MINREGHNWRQYGISLLVMFRNFIAQVETELYVLFVTVKVIFPQNIQSF